jgi:amino acid transporter
VVLLGVTGLVLAYVVIALLLLSINLYSNWSWRIKTATIIVVSLFYIVTYFSLPPLMGWPTDAKLPERFALIGAHVREPDKLLGAEGVIFLWVTEMIGGTLASEPRAYRVPFTPEFHAQVVSAVSKLRKGLPQLGEARAVDKAPVGRPTETKRGGQVSLDIQFYDLPDPLFPEK